MRINDIVIFTGESNSWDVHDSVAKLYIAEGLIVGEKYIVSNYSEGDWTTNIQLIGCGDKWYSLSCFKEDSE